MELLAAQAPEKNTHTLHFFFEGEAINLPGLQLSKEEFQGKASQLLLVRTPEGRKLALAGLGSPKDFWPEILRRSTGKAARALRDSACSEFSLILPEGKGLKTSELARASAEAVILSLYSFDKYKSKKDSPKNEVKRVHICGKPLGEVGSGVSLGVALASSSNFARALANEPPNIATPEWMAEQARSLAGQYHLRFEEVGCSQLEKEGLSGIKTVSQGSEHEGRLVILEYSPKGHEKEAPVVLVGKGLCFDSGGLDIKPAGQFADMKFDKAGACAVLGIMRACGELKLPLRVIGLVALAENLPSGRSYKPGEVLTIAGKTIEVANTDAEGRIVLADALAYSQRFKPRALIDLATLTGACLIALGDQASGLLGTDEKLLKSLESAGRASGERVWPFPLWPEYVEQVKGEIADVKNLGASGAGGRGMAGTIAAAAFLKHFADPTPWVHLDIAGTANVTKPTDYLSTGATGVGVRLVTELLLEQFGSSTPRR